MTSTALNQLAQSLEANSPNSGVPAARSPMWQASISPKAWGNGTSEAGERGKDEEIGMLKCTEHTMMKPISVRLHDLFQADSAASLRASIDDLNGVCGHPAESLNNEKVTAV